MTFLSRLLSTTVLVAVLASTGPVAAAKMFDPRSPSPTGSYLAGQAALRAMQTDSAAGYLRDALEGDYDHPQVVQTALVAFAADGRLQQAADVARHLLEMDEGNPLALLVLATYDLSQSNYQQVVTELEPLGPQSFAGITGAIVRAWALVGLDRYDEAMDSLGPVADGGLGDFLVFHRALMADFAGRHDEAIDLMAQAYETDSYVARIVEAYLRMLGRQGRFDEASAVLQNYAAEGLAHPLITAVAEDIEAHRAPAPFAATIQSGAAEMYHGIGVALARERNPEMALMFLRVGVTLDPRADVIAMVLGQFLDDAGRHEAANALYDAVPSGSPMKPTAVVRMAENIDSMGNRTEAIRRLRNISTANPDQPEAFSVLGDTLRADKQYGEAAKIYSRVIDMVEGDQPGDWRYYYVRGIAYERNKEWPKAEADFKRALELRPDQPQVLNYLGYSWVDQGSNLVEALAMIEKAVAAAPNDGYIIDSLGWAYYRLGRYDEAVETLERAVMLKPNDPEINDHLGDAYWHAGRKLEARFQYNIAMSVDKEGTVRERVEKKLASPDQGPLDEPTSAPLAADGAQSEGDAGGADGSSS